MKFTIRGLIKGQEEGREITWEDGELSGDEIAVGMLRAIAEVYEGKPAGPPPTASPTTNHLADPLSVAFLINEEVFDRILEATGDVPEPDELPEGAIA